MDWDKVYKAYDGKRCSAELDLMGQINILSNAKIVKTLNVLLIGISKCNLACNYCYCRHEQMQIMDVKSFITIFNKLNRYFASDVEFHLVFHGGEPLLLGKSFYRVVFSFLKGQQRAFHTSIQTNLTLLDEEFMSIFTANNCTVGTSIDGSKLMHDTNRIYKDGRGTYDDVLRAVNALEADEAPFGGFVVTLNDTNIASAENLYDSLRCFRGASIGFSIVFKSTDTSETILDSEQLGGFLVDLFDIWVHDDSPLRLTFFENIIRNCLGINLCPECTFSKQCADNFLAINALGDVFTCCDFEGMQKFSYGNILSSDFQDIWESPIRRALLDRLSKRTISQECCECEHFDICNSGCMAKTTRGFSDRDCYCFAYRMLFSHIRGQLPALIACTHRISEALAGDEMKNI